MLPNCISISGRARLHSYATLRVRVYCETSPCFGHRPCEANSATKSGMRVSIHRFIVPSGIRESRVFIPSICSREAELPSCHSSSCLADRCFLPFALSRSLLSVEAALSAPAWSSLFCNSVEIRSLSSTIPCILDDDSSPLKTLLQDSMP
eukprot:2611631-Rhodomonas_salina.1